VSVSSTESYQFTLIKGAQEKNEWQYQAPTQLHDGRPQSLKFDKVMVCDISLELWNPFCRLHNEIILVGPSIVTTKQNSDPTKDYGLSSTIWYYILHHKLISKRIYATTMWKGGGHYVYHSVPSTKLCPKQESMAPCAILCTVQFVIPLLLTFVL
jgi:hypothetical protein